MPSWATVATRVPSAANIRPMPEPTPARRPRATPGCRGSTRRRAPDGGTTWRGRGWPAAAAGRSRSARAGGSRVRAACSRRRRPARRRGPAGRRAAVPSALIQTLWWAASSGPGATNRLFSTWRCSIGRLSRWRAPGWSMPPNSSASDRSWSGPGHVGHRVLVVQPARGLLERGDHRQDRQPVLDRVDPPGRERVAVPHPLDGEPDRLGVVAGPHEVAVQRVDPPWSVTVVDVLHRATGRHHALGQHLAAEDPPVGHLLAASEEHRGARTRRSRRGPRRPRR